MEWKISEKNENWCVLYPWNVNFGGFGGYIKNIQCGDEMFWKCKKFHMMCDDNKKNENENVKF